MAGIHRRAGQYADLRELALERFHLHNGSEGVSASDERATMTEGESDND